MSNGLYNGFKLNRPLTEEEINYQLRQDFSGMGTASSNALDNGVVIRMNSTYLELVDQYYEERGLLDTYSFILFLTFFFGFFLVFFVFIFRPNPELELSFSSLGAGAIMILLLSGGILFFLKY